MEWFSLNTWLFAALVVLILIVVLRRNARVKNFSERRVFITGCDTGFGRSLALRLDSKGVPVYAGCLHHKSVEELTVSCSTRLKAICIDVTDTESIRKAAEFVKNDLNGKALWAIVNNAGVLGSLVPFEWTTREHCRRIIEVNLLGTYEVTLAFLPLLKVGGQGRIVNMSSANGRIAVFAHGYSISKFGIEAFSDGLSYDVRPYNISVHLVEPGLFKTSMINMETERGRIRGDFYEMNSKTRQEFGEEYLNEYLKYVTTMFETGASLKTHVVIDAYEHAILARYPRNRYLVGTDAKYVVGPLSHIPHYCQMIVFSMLEKFAGTRLPSPKFTHVE